MCDSRCKTSENYGLFVLIPAYDKFVDNLVRWGGGKYWILSLYSGNTYTITNESKGTHLFLIEAFPISLKLVNT